MNEPTERRAHTRTLSPGTHGHEIRSSIAEDMVAHSQTQRLARVHQSLPSISAGAAASTALTANGFSIESCGTLQRTRSKHTHTHTEIACTLTKPITAHTALAVAIAAQCIQRSFFHFSRV